ncbi:hypothetical protein LQR31_22830 [Chromobacterium vaccinii]|uniref:hypothetical protein n=1 Tax=Chromobacterium vaccinii TaxID=1108595 RepID=UPI001E3F5E23|nr:hypothetical protein [Chromobacterium vaccinii]MCD4487309.1 hypothetical protein [Chromobacterium vaccinii]
MFSRIGKLLAVLLAALPLWAKADEFVGGYTLLPSGEMQQVYGDDGKPLHLLTVEKRDGGYWLRAQGLSGSGEAEKAELQKNGKRLAQWLGNEPDAGKPIQSCALVGDRIALFRIAKGTELQGANGRAHVMRTDYLLVMPGIDLELERAPETE